MARETALFLPAPPAAHRSFFICSVTVEPQIQMLWLGKGTVHISEMHRMQKAEGIWAAQDPLLKQRAKFPWTPVGAGSIPVLAIQVYGTLSTAPSVTSAAAMMFWPELQTCQLAFHLLLSSF